MILDSWPGHLYLRNIYVLILIEDFHLIKQEIQFQIITLGPCINNICSTGKWQFMQPAVQTKIHRREKREAEPVNIYGTRLRLLLSSNFTFNKWNMYSKSIWLIHLVSECMFDHLDTQSYRPGTHGLASTTLSNSQVSFNTCNPIPTA